MNKHGRATTALPTARTKRHFRIVPVILTLFLANLSHADSIETYLALGDSIAFGVTNVTPVSFGDQGYVSLYADFLAALSNGIRPHVVNLAIPGETSTGFFTAISPSGLPPHDLLASFNLNYQSDPSMSQNALLLTTLAAEAAAGRAITNVSFAIGVNDLAAIEQLHPDFLMLPPAQQQQLISVYSVELTNNYITVLTQLRSALPGARLLLLNYYNPDGSFPPDDPFNIANTIFEQVQSSVVDNLAAPFHASVVDINTPFRGRENELTFISSGGVHPTDQGYAVIEQQMALATVPEPSSITLLGAGLGALAVLLLRKRIPAFSARDGRRGDYERRSKGRLAIHRRMLRRVCKVNMRLPIFIAYALPLYGAPQPATSNDILALTHAAVMDVENGRLLPDRTVVIRGNHIESLIAGNPAKLPTSARVIDCRGKYLIPGLWDMHVHGALHPWLLTLSAVNGVLGVRDMGMPLEPLLKNLKRTADGYKYSGDLPIPVRVGAIAGPMLDGYEQWRGFTMVVRNAEEGRHAVDVLHSAGVDFIKIHTQLSAETWSAVVARARQLGMRFAGHVPYAVSAAAASDAGQASIEHLEGLPIACSSEEQRLRSEAVAHTPGPDGTAVSIARRFATRLVRSFDAEKCEALARLLAKNRTWVVPNLIGLDPASYLPQQANPRFKYIPDFLLDLWHWDPERLPDEAAAASPRLLFQEDLDIVRVLRRNGVRLMTGTDSPAPGVYPGFSVHDDLDLLVRAGLTPAEALRAATFNPALFLNMSDRLGSIAEGKIADLVLLDADPLRDIRNTTRIRAIIADGRLFDRAALDKVLRDLVRK